MNRSAEHTQLVADTRLALGLESDFTIWLNVKVQMVKGQPRAMPGLGTGSSDLIGILNTANAPGRLIALEAKTGNAVPTSEQKDFMNLVRNRGGFASVFRSVDEARACLDRARVGLSE